MPLSPLERSVQENRVWEQCPPSWAHHSGPASDAAELLPLGRPRLPLVALLLWPLTLAPAGKGAWSHYLQLQWPGPRPGENLPDLLGAGGTPGCPPQNLASELLIPHQPLPAPPGPLWRCAHHCLLLGKAGASHQALSPSSGQISKSPCPMGWPSALLLGPQGPVPWTGQAGTVICGRPSAREVVWPLGSPNRLSCGRAQRLWG